MSMYEKGMNGLEISQFFVRLDIEVQDILTVTDAQAFKILGRNLEIENYNPLEIDYFLRKVLIDCFKDDMDTFQIASRLRFLNIKNFYGNYYTPQTITGLVQRLFDGRKLFEMKHIYIEPLIEHLLRTTNFGAFRIVVEIGWCSANDPRNIKQSMADRLMGYLDSRYGFKKITEARIFFRSNYLGYHEYDRYYF